MLVTTSRYVTFASPAVLEDSNALVGSRCFFCETLDQSRALLITRHGRLPNLSVAQTAGFRNTFK